MGAELFGRECEVLAEGAGEGFMRAVAGGEGDGEDIRRALRESVRGVREAAGAGVGGEGFTGGEGEGAREVKARDVDAGGDGFQREVALGKVAFDIPEGFGGEAHSLLRIRRMRVGRLMIVAVVMAVRESRRMAFDEGLADRIRRVVPVNEGVVERKMFGGLAFLRMGHMFCGVVKSDLMLRLGDEAVATALREPHTRPMDFTGKPLRSMLYVDARGVDSDEALERWVAAALGYVRLLPAKK